MGKAKLTPKYEIFIPFPDPQGKEREEMHVVFQGKQIVKRYKRTPNKTRNNLNIVKNSVLHIFEETDSDSVFKVEILALFKRPQKLLGKDLDKTIYVGKKPDWDNIGKLICDGINNLIWKDDAQIAIGKVIKRFIKIGEEPGVKVKIWKIQKKH